MSHAPKNPAVSSVRRLSELLRHCARWLWRLVGRFGCAHEWRWSHNYYGDQIIYSGWNRSAWKCTRCGAWQDRPELHNP